MKKDHVDCEGQKMKLTQEKLLEMDLHRKVSQNYSNIREKNRQARYYKDYWIRSILSLFDKKHKKILDYGCGTGILYPYIKAKFNSSYTGIDISKDMLELAKNKFPRIKLVQMDGEALKFKPNSFDAVIVFGSLHHVPDPKKAIMEIRKVLSSKGSLLISEPTSNKLIAAIRKQFYKSKKHFGPSHKSFLHNELILLVKEHGFKIKKIRYFGLFAFPFGLPDIVPFAKYLPLPLLQMLIRIDEFLLKVPMINSFRFATTILAEKQEQ